MYIPSDRLQTSLLPGVLSNFSQGPERELNRNGLAKDETVVFCTNDIAGWDAYASLEDGFRQHFHGMAGQWKTIERK